MQLLVTVTDDMPDPVVDAISRTEGVIDITQVQERSPVESVWRTLPADLNSRFDRISSEIPAHVVQRMRRLIEDTYERGVDDGEQSRYH